MNEISYVWFRHDFPNEFRHYNHTIQVYYIRLYWIKYIAEENLKEAKKWLVEFRPPKINQKRRYLLYIDIRTHTHTHTRAHAHTHAHTHTQTHCTDAHTCHNSLLTRLTYRHTKTYVHVTNKYKVQFYYLIIHQ